MSDETSLIPAWIGRRWRVAASALVAALAAVMVALVLLVHHQRDVDQETREAVVQSYVLRAHMQHVFSLVQDVETGSRGFVITGQDAFLAPYAHARGELPSETAQLRGSLLHPSDRAYVDRLDRLVRQKLELA